jgi:hypothetical protein
MKARIKITLSAEQRLIIESAANLLGQRPSEYLRMAGMEKSLMLRDKYKGTFGPLTNTTTQAPAKSSVQDILARMPAGMKEGTLEFAKWYAAQNGQEFVDDGET